MKKLLSLILLLNVFTGCNQEEGQVNIIVSTYATEYIVKAIVGDSLVVSNIIPDGVDIHEYEPTQKDIQTANDADIVFIVDEHFEETLSSIDGTISILDNIEADYDNPHFWMSPEKMIEATDFIYKKLGEEYDKDFEDNYLALKKKLEDLDSKYQSELKNTKHDTFIVSHNSFIYLEDYDVYSIALTEDGHGHGSDTSQKELLETIDYVNENNIKYIAKEVGIECSNCNVIASETSAEILEIDSFEYPTKDTDYVTNQEQNLEILKKLLN